MSAATYLMGIDIGTYSSKGVLVAVNPATGDGTVVASHVTPHSIEMPHPGWVEQDADGIWWQDCIEICRQLLAQSGIDSRRIAALGISTTAPCVLPVDATGQPLRPGILYGIDTRATAEIAELEAELGVEVLFERYGVKLSSQSTSPKLLWLRKHEPAVWAKTHLLLSGAGYLVFRLTGEAVLDIYDAGAYAPLFDVRTCAWNPDMADRLAPSERLPRLAWSCEIAGKVTSEAAARTGLAEGTPVITGTADAAAEAISAGLAHPGDLMVMYGSSIFFILKTDQLYNSRQFWGTRFLEPHTYAVAGGMSTAGSLTRWFRDNFAVGELAGEAGGGENAYAVLAELAAASPPGARGLVALPYFAGERTPIFDPDAKGLLIGLTLSHSRGDVYRALLESVGYGIRHNLDAMRSEGMAPTRILAVGGGTLNRSWMQMVSDIAGIEQHIPAQQIGAAYGDAFLAGVGVGLFGSTRDAGRWVQMQQIVKPDASTHARYSHYYEVYRQVYRETAASMHRLGELAQLA
jgi:xylulokinase